MIGITWHTKLLLNHSYLYFLNAYHLLAGILPEPLRGLLFRLVLAKVGRGVYFDNGVFFKFPRLVQIGDRVSINRGCEFYPSFFGKSVIKLGSNVRIGPHCRFFGAGHETSGPSFADKGGDIIVGDNCWIGGNATILAGVEIGENSIVAAGAVVTKSMPAQSIVAGVPARVIGRRNMEPAE